MEIRPLSVSEWPAAMTLAARAFTNMAFIRGLFGDDPVVRFERALGFYRATPWNDSAVHLCAFIADELVGVSVASPPGSCYVCQNVDPATPPDDPLQAEDWEWYRGVLALHHEYPPHGYINRVVTDPSLQGAGIGARLVAESLNELRFLGTSLVLLECESVTEPFYLRAGFERATYIPDPVSDACLMRITLNAVNPRE